MNDQGLLALVNLVLDAVADGKAALADGKITVMDLPRFLNLIPDLLAALGSLALVPGEVKALTPEQDAAIVAHVMQRLGVSNAKAATIAAAALKLATDSYADITALLAAIQAAPTSQASECLVD